MTDQGQSAYDQGIAAFRAGRTAEAIRLLKEAVSENPRDQRSYMVLGAAHIQRREFDDAIVAFERARDIRPDQAPVHYNLGLAYQRAGRPQEAQVAFRAALEVDPSYEKAKEALDRAAPQQAPATPDALTGPPADTPAPASPSRMPMLPPEEKLTEAPAAPWQSTAQTAASKAYDDSLELRPMGGPQEPRPQTTAPQPAAGLGEPPKPPWETEVAQVRPTPRPRPQASEAPPRRAPGEPLRRPGAVPRGRATARTQEAQAIAGALAGAIYGAIFLGVLTVVDHFLGAKFGIIRQAMNPGWVPLIIGGVVAGGVLGAIIGAATVLGGSATVGVYASIGIWVFMALILVLRAHASGAALIIGLGMGAAYGAVMGFLVANQVDSSVKRQG
jgi:tetratricopeptide (TPR) repeat protein